jgi:NAD(P)-dependent dehydrogenase (short-subunit alcohol dehydrogenase family)
MELAGHTYLITGATSGLGAACAEEFSRGGANVLLADRQPLAAKRLAADFPGERAAFCQTDVTDPHEVQLALDQARSQFGRLDGLVHCAGILTAARLVSRTGTHDLDLFRRTIEVNLIGTFNLLRLSADVLRQNEPNAEGERGVVVTTASVAAWEGQIGQVAYAASKGGVAAMTLPAARELAGYGIRVVSIAPGAFETPMLGAAPEKVVASLQAQTVFPRRLGRPTEFARFARQVVENPMLNGCVLRLDGAVRMSAQ